MLNRRQLLKNSASLILFPCLKFLRSNKEANMVSLSPMAQEIEKYFTESTSKCNLAKLNPHNIDGFYLDENMDRIGRKGVYWLWDRKITPDGNYYGCSTDFTNKYLKYKYGSDYEKKFIVAVKELNNKYGRIAA
jgi:hypothetical protein